MDSGLSLILGFILGLLSNWFIAWRIALTTYEQSIANRRLEQLVVATVEFKSDLSKVSKERITGYLHNKHRHVFSPIIDALFHEDNQIEFKRWHFAVTLHHIATVKLPEEEDRWKQFEFYFRPVLDAAETYGYITYLRHWQSKSAERLYRFKKFAIAFENVVEQIDACMEIWELREYIIRRCNPQDELINLQIPTSPQITELHTAIENLWMYWQCWIRFCERTDNQWREAGIDCP